MTTFHSNIISVYGEKGQAWLDELPHLATIISSRLDLRDLKEVTNRTYSYVLSGFQGDNPIILKLGLDNGALAREAFALKCFAGYGAVKVLAEDESMLLWKERRLAHLSNVIFRIGSRNLSKLHVGSCRLYIKQIFLKITHSLILKIGLRLWIRTGPFLMDIFKKQKLRDELLQTSKPDVLLHGDLHHDNILQNSDDEARHSFSDGGWLVIDPKGVIGEPAYEVTAFIRNPIPELLNHADAPNIIHNRVTRFAELLELPYQRILDWCFVESVLSWTWDIEGNLDTAYWRRLTECYWSCIHK